MGWSEPCRAQAGDEGAGAPAGLRPPQGREDLVRETWVGSGKFPCRPPLGSGGTAPGMDKSRQGEGVDERYLATSRCL